MTKLNLPIAVPDADEDFEVVARGESSQDSQTNSLESSEGITHKRFISLMIAALENPAGVRIKRQSKNDAIAMRHRLYRARQWYRRAGFSSLEKLIIRVEEKGFAHYVYIQPEEPIQLEIL